MQGFYESQNYVPAQNLNFYISYQFLKRSNTSINVTAAHTKIKAAIASTLYFTYKGAHKVAKSFVHIFLREINSAGKQLSDF